MKSVFGGPVRGHVQVELLSAYLDQQASPAERAYVDAHLQQCAECRAELESLRRTVFLLQALPRVPVPRAFTLSEAQVGIRRPDASRGWLGGLVRGLGAVAAIALVAFVAFSVLKPGQAPWNPAQTVARVSPTTAPVAQAPAPQPAAVAAPTQATEAQPAAAARAVQPQPPTTNETSPTPEPAPAALAAAPSEPTAAAADAATTAPAESATASNEGTTAATAAASEAAPEPTATNAAPLIAKAAPSAAPAAGVMGATAAGAAAAPGAGGAPAATGRGGGGPSEPGVPPEYLTPEPTPEGRPLATTLPSGVRLAYADLNALWAIDRDGGVRQLVQGKGINTPQLSPDQQWIAYRLYTDQGMQIWAVTWAGGTPRLLLDDATLPTDGLPKGYIRRAISDTRWAPKGDVLTVTMTLVPDPNSTEQPKTELWQVDVQTSSLKELSDLGRAWRPYYSPDGSAYLVLQYGTDADPQGSLSLVDAKSGKGKAVMTFPASPSKNGYDNQVVWASDGKTAWVAIPIADYGTPVPPNGTKLYRVNAVSGDAKEVGQVDATQVNWSPTANAMAYTRYTDDTMATNELYLANADGSQAQKYASMNQGEFINWSPEGDRFIYQDNFQVFEGENGEAPKKLANANSMVSPRWISDSQIMASHDTGDGWMLTLRDVNGDAASLLPLPREAMWDVRSY